ncbi:peptidase domain-containing ABC transporter [Teichococcus aestuarii]|uniref:ABC transporter n=1 Tax=Teichococcus aestuarii TaxID=568898 RepID=A0A2U1V109_9PROT|nr:ATP-binding cassette domain-containing protein [Pseudoroseomonas aestuarii]PWC27584.1 ABC transporter [Pseudoroseomonas aestuarii]
MIIPPRQDAARAVPAAPEQASRTAPHGDTEGGAALRSLLNRLAQLQALVRRSRHGLSGDEGDERLFCALCLTAGTDFPLRQLLAALPAEPAPMDADGIIAAMGHLGFCATPLARLPAQPQAPLLHDGGGEGASVILRLPGSNRMWRLWPSGAMEELASSRQLGRGTLWSFPREGDTHPLSAARRSHTGHRWFRALMAKFGWLAGGLILVSLAIAGVSTALPLFTIQIYHHVISLGSLEPLPMFALGMALIVLIEGLLVGQRSRMLAWIANRLEFLVAGATFERILKIRPAISERASVTDQVARLRTFENVRNFITGPAFIALLEAPITAASLGLLAAVAGWVVVVPLLGILAHLWLFSVLLRRARVMTSIAADESTEMQRMTIETFQKREVIRQAGLQHQWSGRMIGCVRRQQVAQLDLRMVGAAGDAISTFILTTATMLMLAAGTEAVWAGTLGTGGLLACTILGRRAMVPSHMLCLSVQRCEQLRNSLGQLNGLMEIPPERDEVRQYSQARPLQGGISFLNTGFRAADTRPVFVGLDLEIPPGSRIGITGANGSGKTTVLKLVQGLSDLTIGAVRLDGVDLRQLPPDELRRRIAYVPQHPRLFPGTLRDNLLFVNPLAEEGKLRLALQAARLAEAVEQLEDGLDHRCDETKAFPLEFHFKFAVAQALLTESNILLIDEVPNRLLDGEVGRVIRDIITQRSRSRTVLFVSHRSDFLALAERVVVLRYGKVPAVTTPAALVQGPA